MEDKFEFPDEIDEKDPDAVAQSDDLEVEIVDDTPEKDRGRKPLEREIADPTEDEIDSYTGNVQKRIKELTHARHDERRAKEALMREKQELERLAQHMVEENKKLKQYVNSGSEQYADSMKKVANSGVESARRALKEANESFDPDAIIAAQEALLEAKLEMRDAEKFRVTPLQIDADEVKTTSYESSKQEVDQKTLRWQAQNQWFGASGNEEMTSFALGLHQKLVNSGIDPRSDEYFERINARMKSTFHEFFGESEDRPRSNDAPRRPNTVVAPATRSTGARKVQLTPTQVALAKKFGLTPQQYAVELAKMERSNG
tara:strand:+ start:1076 stop:2023 length:948 start_codon:yes stop_codon:yes gene_type:complete